MCEFFAVEFVASPISEQIATIFAFILTIIKFFTFFNLLNKAQKNHPHMGEFCRIKTATKKPRQKVGVHLCKVFFN
jgi:hypothetical protein